ncbi:MAG: GNAT family N-acetyltransferase [Ruminococcaceae bacterium]|nr:GNAT family N-acetyltransferase [Oscillospiraceae bacterium]
MIRRAKEKDLPKIEDLLRQVDLVHHVSRPDIFKIGQKYSADELVFIIRDDSKPVLVYTDEGDNVLGYCFCIFQQHVDHSVLTDIKTLYIDDLCVDEEVRGKHIGRALYDAAVRLAKESGCYNLTLNVWSCNASAMKFYESCGLVAQKVGMELVLY